MRFSGRHLKTLIVNDEKNLSAQQSTTKADPRLPRPHGHSRRQEHPQAPAQQGPASTDRHDPGQATRLARSGDGSFGPEHRLRRRSEFLRIQRSGLRQQTAHFVVYLAKLPGQSAPRMGVTVSRAIGSAVVRNRVKRRLREGFRCSLKQLLGTEDAMVVIARQGAADLSGPAVLAEIKPTVFGLVHRIEATRPRPAK